MGTRTMRVPILVPIHNTRNSCASLCDNLRTTAEALMRCLFYDDEPQRELYLPPALSRQES